MFIENIKFRIDKIKQLEVETEERLENARQAARDLVEQSKQDKKRIVQEAKNIALKKLDKTVRSAEDKGKGDAKRIIEDIKKEAGKLGQKAGKNREEAVNLIMTYFFQGEL